GRLAAGGKGRNQNVVEACSLRHLLLERVRARPQRLIREPLELLLQRIDRCDPRKVRLDSPLVRRTKQLAGNDADHAVSPSRPVGWRWRTLPNPTGRNATAEAIFVATMPARSLMAVECGKCRTFRTSIMQTAAACGRVGRVCGEIGGGHTLVNRPSGAH